MMKTWYVMLDNPYVIFIPPVSNMYSQNCQYYKIRALFAALLYMKITLKLSVLEE